MAILYTTDGSVVNVEPKNGTDFKYDELSGFVDGYIEIVPLKRTGGLLVVNEEGKLKGLEPNSLATEIWVKNYGWTDVIVGNALFCKDGEIL